VVVRTTPARGAGMPFHDPFGIVAFGHRQSGAVQVPAMTAA
jgi:hypothetical protein